jgi:hypothetical protein
MPVVAFRDFGNLSASAVNSTGGALKSVGRIPWPYFLDLPLCRLSSLWITSLVLRS